MDIKKYNKAAIVFILIVFLLSIMVGMYCLGDGGNAVMIILALISLIGGPLCLIAYIKEVRKGIFVETEEEVIEKDGE